MGDWTAFYEVFWRHLRETRPDLPLDQGYHTHRDGEPSRAYQGHRHPRVRNAYCHIRFIGRGSERDLVIEYFTAWRDDVEWQPLLKKAVSRLAVRTTAESSGKSTATIRFVLKSGMSVAAAARDRSTLAASAARTYMAFLDAWKD